MAWVTKETVKSVREALKANFPNARFGVRGTNSSSLVVTIKKSELFKPEDKSHINHYHYDRFADYNKDQVEFIGKMIKTCREASSFFDKSDSMTDYFHCSHYESYNIDVK